MEIFHGKDFDRFREHIYEYMQFVRKVLQEADQLDNYAAHLCATARNMMELLHIIYANLHEKKARDFPYLTGRKSQHGIRIEF